MSTKQQDVNFIKHLNAILEQFASDDRITPYHISLYLALFSRWNAQRFKNPIQIFRDEMMNLSKIRSNKTYLLCLNHLHQYGYIKYEPSFNAMLGTKVYLLTTYVTDTQPPVQNLCSKDTAPYTGLTQPTIYNKTTINNINLVNSPPSINEILEFFKKENYSEIEAQKFYNYFQSNGWLVGGKAKMKDWKAAARNWMLNAQKFNAPKHEKSNKLHTNPNKDYSEPL
jgi:hypothetical protein